MRKLSRRHKENIEKTNKTIYSTLDEAIEVLKSTATTKFIETVSNQQEIASGSFKNGDEVQLVDFGKNFSTFLGITGLAVP